MVTTKELANLRKKAGRERSQDTRNVEARNLSREIRERRFDRTPTGRFLRGAKRVGSATGRGIGKASTRIGKTLDKAEGRRKMTQRGKKQTQPSISDLF